MLCVDDYRGEPRGLKGNWRVSSIGPAGAESDRELTTPTYVWSTCHSAPITGTLPVVGTMILQGEFDWIISRVVRPATPVGRRAQGAVLVRL